MADYYPESEGFASYTDSYAPEDFALAQFDAEQANQLPFTIEPTGWDGIGPITYDPKYDEPNPLNTLPGITEDDLKKAGIDLPSDGSMSVDGVLGKLKSVAEALGLTKGGNYDWKKAGIDLPSDGSMSVDGVLGKLKSVAEALGLTKGGNYDWKKAGIDLPSDGSMSVDGVLGKLKSVAEALGLTKGGNYDWKKILGLGAAGLTAYDTLNRKEVPVKTIQQLSAGMPSNTPPGFSQGALTAMQKPMLAGNELARQASADMPTPIRPGVQGYAEGGEVYGPLSQTADQLVGLVQGAGGGQDDMVEARLSPGEYVFDSESVSMLGDGDNAAGARKLDELRAAMREHKRSAPPGEIAPRSLGPLSYMNGGLNA